MLSVIRDGVDIFHDQVVSVTRTLLPYLRVYTVAGNEAYHFLIVLLGSDPLIWRRIEVPRTYSFWGLHIAI